MLGVVGIITLLVALGLSLVITRLATIALSMTGLSEEEARFQARSAFTGTGFTTEEAEHVVNHPVRRRIVMLLMILRSAGLVTVVISLILSFVGPAGDFRKLYRVLWIVGGVVLLVGLSHSRWVDPLLQRAVRWSLKRWTRLNVVDYTSMLRLRGDYMVTQVSIGPDDWLADRPLRDCDLSQEGVTVLGVVRPDGEYVGGPTGETEIHDGDTLIVYGRSELLHELDRREKGPEGDRAHRQAVSEEERRAERQRRDDAAHEARRNQPSYDKT